MDILGNFHTDPLLRTNKEQLDLLAVAIRETCIHESFPSVMLSHHFHTLCHPLLCVRVKRRDAETKTRLRTLAEIGVPVSTLERHKSLQTQTLINPWDEDQPTNIIMKNGTLVKVLGWHRQQIIGATNKTLLYAHARACDNEKQQGMIRAGKLSAE